MANRFSQNFTLADIFNNKKLEGKLPLINYKEIQLEEGKVSVRTNAKTVNRLVFDTATSSAKPFYKPIKTTKSGNTLIIDGTLVGDHDAAVDAVYNSLMNQKSVIVWTANNADMIRSAIKESEKNRRKYGINSKLYLRANSMQQIEGMSKPQIQALMTDIMENIIYGDDFPQTQKKFNIKDMLDAQTLTPSALRLSYSQRRLRWKYKVGDL